MTPARNALHRCRRKPRAPHRVPMPGDVDQRSYCGRHRRPTAHCAL